MPLSILEFNTGHCVQRATDAMTPSWIAVRFPRPFRHHRVPAETLRSVYLGMCAARPNEPLVTYIIQTGLYNPKAANRSQVEEYSTTKLHLSIATETRVEWNAEWMRGI